MTKPLAVAAVLVLALVVFVAEGARSLDGPAVIRVTQRIDRVHTNGAHRITTAYLRDRRTHRIGWSVLSCVNIGAGSSQCTATYRLPLGRLVAAGVRKNDTASYVLAVTGGTAYYNAAGGTLFVRGVGSDVELLLFSLE